MPARRPGIDLEALERDAVGYFLRAANPGNGLIADSSRPGAPCSIAATGLGLAALVVGAERGFLPRRAAAEQTLRTLRFFRDSPQSEEPDATGHRGFYYHFLDFETGRRTWDSELSMVDTAILIAGVLTSGEYFSAASDDEREIRQLARLLYERVDWTWAARDDRRVVSMGWKPGAGFLSYGWGGYSEALLLYVLGLGSPTHPLPAESYDGWTTTYQWENLYDIDFLFAAPLFIHQLSHVWIDFRGIQDALMREKRSDYFENSRRATLVQRQYAQRNPRRFAGYGKDCWGVTAGAGPGFTKQVRGGIERHFYGYVARGVPFGPDDGTLAPWAAVTSLPFAPEFVLPALEHVLDTYPEVLGGSGLLASFNPTFDTGDGSHHGWVSPEHYGLDQGPVALMIENHRSGFLWSLMRECPVIVTGLRRAGFRKGWLRASAG